MITGVGIDYPETFQDLDEQFSSDDVSLDYIVKLRWQKNFVVPGTKIRRKDRLWWDVVSSFAEMEWL